MRGAIVTVSGALISLSSLPHGLLAWPAMCGELSHLSAPGNLVGGLGAGWYFGTAAMLTFGILVMAAGLRMRRGDNSMVFVVRAVALCYLVFGVIAFFLRHMNPHFLFFIALGLAAGLPVARRSASASRT
jgi:hypothetical protein